MWDQDLLYARINHQLGENQARVTPVPGYNEHNCFILMSPEALTAYVSTGDWDNVKRDSFGDEITPDDKPSKKDKTIVLSEQDLEMITEQ